MKHEQRYVPELDHGKTKRGRKATAEELLRRCAEEGVDPAATLTAEDVRRWMNITHGDKHMIDMIASGWPVRNAQTILKAISIKLDRSSPKPISAPPESAGITVTVNTLTPAEVITTGPESVSPVKITPPPPGAEELDEEFNA